MPNSNSVLQDLVETGGGGGGGTKWRGGGERGGTGRGGVYNGNQKTLR